MTMRRTFLFLVYLHLIALVVSSILLILNVQVFTMMKLIGIGLVGTISFLALIPFHGLQTIFDKVMTLLGTTLYLSSFAVFVYPDILKSGWIHFDCLNDDFNVFLNGQTH